MGRSNWVVKTIDQLKAKIDGAIGIGPFGSRMKSDTYVSSGVPVIRGSNISDTRELVGEMVFITPEKADELGSAIVFADDLFFPHRGAIGRVGIVPSKGAERYALSTSLMKLTCDTQQVEPLYLFYFFRSAEGRHELLKNASTVGTPGIGQPLSSLRTIKASLPPLAEQKAIARVLGNLDDKIELNRRMNTTLEAMARTLFKSWFVDFDPVHAKIKSQTPAGLDEATAALFPDRFQESPLGRPIPRGWEVKRFGDFVERLSVGKKYDQKSAFPVGAVPILDQGKSGVIGFHSNDPGVTASLDEPVAVFANHTCYMRGLQGPIRLLPQLSRGCLVTTNFDPVIELVIGKGNLEGYMHGMQQGNKFVPKLIKGDRCILKLHGDAEDYATYVFTESQYKQAYGGSKTQVGVM